MSERVRRRKAGPRTAGEIAHAHGGALWLRDGPSGGARFVLRPPRFPNRGANGDVVVG